MIQKIEAVLLRLLQRRCTHPSNMVAVDILEGSSESMQARYCRRCGAIKIIFDQPQSTYTWRLPEPNLYRD